MTLTRKMIGISSTWRFMIVVEEQRLMEVEEPRIVKVERQRFTCRIFLTQEEKRRILI